MTAMVVKYFLSLYSAILNKFWKIKGNRIERIIIIRKGWKLGWKHTAFIFLAFPFTYYFFFCTGMAPFKVCVIFKQQIYSGVPI